MKVICPEPLPLRLLVGLRQFVLVFRVVLVLLVGLGREVFFFGFKGGFHRGDHHVLVVEHSIFDLDYFSEVLDLSP